MTQEQEFTENWTPDEITFKGSFYEKGKVEIMLFEYAQKQIRALKEKENNEFAKSDVREVDDSVIEPPLGLMPRKLHNEKVKTARFNELREAISRYYNAELEINIEWIEEYNELIEGKGKK